MKTGLFVAFDGPGGAGKSTTVVALAERLAADGLPVTATAQPSQAAIGQLARTRTHEFSGPTLACLVTADRYHHLHTLIRPALARGELVLCDRYTASSLVLQAGLDEVPESFVRELNRFAEPPDLQVVLTAPGEELRARLAVRGSHGRFEDDPTGVTREIALYERLSAQLTREGLVVEVVDTSPGVEEVVSHLAGLIGALWSQGRAAV
ncbi:dTMP kinase [Nocardiopsis tropica]|uniref:Thymidylate kinase n=1 Tax=Nocardiopsis tropica TaxID=109330 RepID=A0ABU7KPW9_9ACTN|nr:dTMP kinase [Nocardiopsis umidischolae]MEE2051339.1 dTMP kinase [Nocardiopsis umidischolae]